MKLLLTNYYKHEFIFFVCWLPLKLSSIILVDVEEIGMNAN